MKRIVFMIQTIQTSAKKLLRYRFVLLVVVAFLPLFACSNSMPVMPVENKGGSGEVSFEEAKNYFFKNDQKIPASPKITTEEEFNQLFGKAAVMGPDGMPTTIDFSKQFVVAVVLPITEIATEIYPVKVVSEGNSLLYTYKVKTGEKQTFTVQPISIIILDKKYENKEVVLVNEQETNK